MTSSSDDKLETVRSHLVAQAGEKAVRLRFHTVNYKTSPVWAIEASFKAIRQSGVIAVRPRELLNG
jgi:hypothetical protein